MTTIWSGALLGRGIGFFGRFALALVILLTLKHWDKGNPYINKGLRQLFFFGIIAVIIMIILVLLWLFVFGFTLPWTSMFGYYRY